MITTRRGQTGGGRRSGCVAGLLWLGVMVNVVLVTWTLRGGAPAWVLGGPATRTPSGAAAVRAYLEGDLLAAALEAQAALAHSPDDVTALGVLVRAWVYHSDADFYRDALRAQALEATTRAVQRQPQDADVLALHAFALVADDQPVAAARTAERALATNAQHVLARAVRSLAYGRVGGHVVALQDAEAAARVDERDVDALRALALAATNTGDYARAARVGDAAIARAPRLLLLHFERAQVARLLGDADAATVRYFSVLAHDPPNVKAQLRLCELSASMGERAAAIGYCLAAARAAPTDSELWYRLGYEQFLSGHFADAQASLGQCATLQRVQNVPPAARRFECWYLQGQAAELVGDCAGLRRAYDEFQVMAADPAVRQRWTVPPGALACVADG